MRVLLLVLLQFQFVNVFANNSERQLYGSHAFLMLSDDYTYSHDIMGYISAEKKIMVRGIRSIQSVDEVVREFAEPSYDPFIKVKNLTKPDRVIYKVQQNSNRVKYSYVTFLGGETESVTISATTFDMHTEETERNVIKALNSAEWRPKSSLNFEEAFYFNIDNLEDLAPSSILPPGIVFTKGGATVRRSDFFLLVEAIPLTMPKGGNGKEQKIVDQLVNPRSELVKINYRVYENVIVDDMRGIFLTREYENKGKITKDKTAVLFGNEKGYVIYAVSKSSDYDHYLEKYRSILESFSIKK